ncbi:hypothetical protein Tco_0371911 [Tanacetum coccineum]
MTTLQFADNHNLVAFLAKPAESEGFEQIVDFLNALTIKYALTVNPTIYTSCIEQFWATVKEGTDCLPNATIFEELTRMGYEKLSQKLTLYKAFFSPQWKFLNHTILQCLSAKTTTWNEFSSTMESAIICVATNQKFNFSKYIFESMVKNLDNAGKFLMYLRFVQAFLDKQLEGMSSHKRIYVTPSHTKKIFGNMKRVGKGFSGMETPLFPTMMVQNQAEMGEGLAIPIDPHHTPTIIQPLTSQPQKKQRSIRPKRKDTEVPQPSSPTTNVADEAVYKEMDDSLEKAATTVIGLDVEHDRGGDPKRQEIIGDTIAQTRFENVSKLSNDPLLARDVLDDEEVFVAEQGVSDKDVNLSVDEVTLAQALAALKKKKETLYRKKSRREKEQTTNKSSTKEYHAYFLKNIEGWKPKDFKSKDSTREQFKRTGDELEQESIKKQKVDEDKETAELKSMMKVILDEEEVAVDAIPLATKPPNIVDWKIHKEGKKSYYQIIRG